MASDYAIDMSDWDAQGRWRSVEDQRIPSCGNRALQIPLDPSGVSGIADLDADTSVGPRWHQRRIWFRIVRCPRLPNR
jgi:predicted secreted protein